MGLDVLPKQTVLWTERPFHLSGRLCPKAEPSTTIAWIDMHFFCSPWHWMKKGVMSVRFEGAILPRCLTSRGSKHFWPPQVTGGLGPLFIRDSANRELRHIFINPATKWFILDFSETIKQ
jgi:hypothetical protein